MTSNILGSWIWTSYHPHSQFRTNGRGWEWIPLYCIIHSHAEPVKLFQPPNYSNSEVIDNQLKPANLPTWVSLTLDHLRHRPAVPWKHWFACLCWSMLITALSCLQRPKAHRGRTFGAERWRRWNAREIPAQEWYVQKVRSTFFQPLMVYRGGGGGGGGMNCTDIVLSIIFTSRIFKHTCCFLRKLMNALLTEPVTLKKIWLALCWMWK